MLCFSSLVPALSLASLCVTPVAVGVTWPGVCPHAALMRKLSCLVHGTQVCHPHLSPGGSPPQGCPRNHLRTPGAIAQAMALVAATLRSGELTPSSPSGRCHADTEGFVRGDVEVARENLPAQVPHGCPFGFVPDELVFHPQPLTECLPYANTMLGINSSGTGRAGSYQL